MHEKYKGKNFVKIAIDFSEFMPKMMTEYALKIMTSSSRNLTSIKEKKYVMVH